MADDVTPLASLSLTHVYYVRPPSQPQPPLTNKQTRITQLTPCQQNKQNPDDPLSHLSAFLALVPQALCVVYATLLWSTREAEVLLMFLGQLACEAVNFALKRLIKEERPRHLHAGARGYGMPSSHAQFVVFWAVAVTLFLLVRHRPLLRQQQQQQQQRKDGSEGGDRKEEKEEGMPSLTDVSRAYRAGGLPAATASIEAYSHAPWNVTQRILVSAAALVVAALVSWSRVYLGYHTVRQVQAGCAAGAVCGVAWFAVTYLLREMGMLAWALEMPLARWFRVRDLVVAEDLCQAGWEKWEVRRREGLERLRQKEKVKGKGGKGE